MYKNKTLLAIDGGTPIRTKPFKSNVITGNREKKIINKVLDKKEFSRFMGGPDKDIYDILKMKSVDALNLKDRYYSFLGGNMIRKFESDFSKKIRTDYSITVNSATSALSVALGACGLGPEDEVITTAMSFTATATSILLFNSIPVFCDVNKSSFNMTARSIEKKITSKTKAILIVHLLGEPVEMDSVMELAKKYNLRVIEDGCQAPGVKYKDKYVGTIGDVGTFSFNEPKNIQTGEGGMIVTNNQLIAKKCRLIRNHGEGIVDENWSDDDLVNIIGHNFRMTELTAALGIAQLTRLDDLNKARIENSNYLVENLQNIKNLEMPKFSANAVPHAFPMRYTGKEVERNKIIKALVAEGINVGMGYLKPMYANEMFVRKIAYGKKGYPWTNSKINYNSGDCPIAENLMRNEFIWFYQIAAPNDFTDMDDVIIAIKKVFNQLDKIKKLDIDKNINYKW
jgi:perosamine synthetase